MELLIYVLKYLQGMLNPDIHFTGAENGEIISYTDADHANSEDRKSTTGTLYVVFRVPEAWFSKKQASVALNICEEEYLTASLSLKEAPWLQRLMAKVANKKSHQPHYVSTIKAPLMSHWAKRKTKYRKHFNIRRNHLSHYVKHGITTIKHIESRHNVLKGLTKPFDTKSHNYIKARLK